MVGKLKMGRLGSGKMWGWMDGWMGGWKDNDDSRAYDSRLLNLIESGNIYAVLSLQGHF
jgi:hypothetical protein